MIEGLGRDKKTEIFFVSEVEIELNQVNSPDWRDEIIEITESHICCEMMDVKREYPRRK